MTDFAAQIRAKGYTVEECRKKWGYTRATWSRHVNNPKYAERLQCMINGLKSKGE